MAEPELADPALAPARFPQGLKPVERPARPEEPKRLFFAHFGFAEIGGCAIREQCGLGRSI
jgi:hypothetical protein